MPGSAELRKVESQRAAVRLEMQALQLSGGPSAAEIDGAVGFLQTFHEEPRLLHDLVHGRLLEAARVSVAGLTTQPCPLCGLRPDDWGEVRQEVSERLERLGPRREQLDSARQVLEGALPLAAANLVGLDGLQEKVPQRQARRDFHEALRAYREWWRGWWRTWPPHLPAAWRRATTTASWRPGAG